MLRSFPSRATRAFPDRDDVIFRGDFFFDAAVEIFVLEEDAGVVVADRGFDEAFGVVGRGGADHFEAGIVDEPHLGILRVEGAAVDVSAAGAAQDERSGSAPEVVRLGDHVADLVEGAADEVHELELGDGAHAGERRAEGRAHDGGLGDGRVDDALGAEAVDESVGDFEGAAVDADVFAEAEDGGIAVHFFPDSLADGFEVGKLHKVSEFQGFRVSKTKPLATDLHGLTRINLLQMDGCFGLLVAAGSLLHFRHAVFWFDFVAAVFAEDAAFG